MIQILKITQGKVIAFKAKGEIDKNDYEQIKPLFDKVLHEHEKIRLIIEIEGLEGFKLDTLWEDINEGVRIAHDIERIAIVGPSEMRKEIVKIADPLFSGEIQAFKNEDFMDAEKWIMT